MRFVALVSGGKDSTFAVSEAIAQGHELVGLAHLSSFSLSGCLASTSTESSPLSVPGTSVERDSWMYQSVGSELVPYLALTFDKNLFWIEPASGDDFNAEEDQYLKSFGASAFVDDMGRVDRDVVRLWRLLRFAKQNLSSTPPQALVSGAILSNYQRTRIEIVCRALGWISISPLWQRDQSTLLGTMASSAGIDARLIRSASIGLNSSHLMSTICPKKNEKQQFIPSSLGTQLKKLATQYGVNECGEGGEYESFSVDANVFPHLKLIPISWSLIDASGNQTQPSSTSDDQVSHVRFLKVALAEKTENSISSVSGLGAGASKALSSLIIRHSETAQWQLGEDGTQFSPEAVKALEAKMSSSGLSLTSLVKSLIEEGRIMIIESKYHDMGALPVKDVDITAPFSRNPLVASDPSIDLLKVSGPHLKFAGGLMGTKINIKPSNKTWPHSNFYIEASHHVYEDCRALGDGSLHAKDISQATQAVMNAIGRKLTENGLSFKHVYFASLTIPSMSFFGDMNPVYSSYFVPVHNPPSRVTVAQRPRHAAHGASSTSDASHVDPSIRVEFWGLVPDYVDAALSGKLAISKNAFFAHNVLHVESYSGWAPACIGPYSQAHEVLGVDHMAGQIALLPSQMTMAVPASSSGSAEDVLFETVLCELKLALKHVVSLVTARSYKGGVLKRPSELLFASMFTSVPAALANRCIEAVLAKGTEEERAAAEYVLDKATLIMVDQLPRLAKVEIQVVIDSPESILADPRDSNLVTHLPTDAKTNVFRTDASSGLTVHTKYNISSSLCFAHTQHVITAPKATKADARQIVATSALVLNTIAPFISSSLQKQEDVLPSFLSANLFYKTVDEDNKEFYELSKNGDFSFTPYPALDLGAPKSWIGDLDQTSEVCAVLHSKWALPLDLDN